jgi:hypothetical protein
MKSYLLSALATIATLIKIDFQQQGFRVGLSCGCERRVIHWSTSVPCRKTPLNRVMLLSLTQMQSLHTQSGRIIIDG